MLLPVAIDRKVSHSSCPSETPLTHWHITLPDNPARSINMTGIDLFAGAGGMSAGAIVAGLNVIFAVESDRHAARAYHRNHPHCSLFVNDILHLPSETVKEIPRGSNATVVFGGPPCQGFSYSNTRSRSLSNHRNWLFQEFLRVVRVWEPDFVVFENVQGIVTTASGFILDIILDRFDQLGYTLSYGILNAVDFGVPQKRRRFFLIGSRDSSSIELPTVTVAQRPTVRDAIDDLPPLANGATIPWLPYRDVQPSEYARVLRNGSNGCSSHLVTKNNDRVIRRYRFVPPGGNWENIPPALMDNYTNRTRCHTGIYHRLRYNSPSIVIGNYRKNMLIHPVEHRGLSVREAARLQSFPDSYEFAGSIGFQQQQVADAVPPMLASAVFRQLYRG